jgi:AraC family transcriptional regulator of adaptative response/methylated-DNA-[protein]-cysteine methyltransferase
MLAIAGDDGIVLLDFLDRKGLQGALRRIKTSVVPGNHAHLDQLESELAEYFAGARRSFDVPIAPIGTAFERRAWEFLQSIPFGQTRSYGDEARALDTPRAVRAVGRANGMNYISIVIPCHRVIGSNGELTGYGGGLARKRWLLDHERRVLASSTAATRTPTAAAAGTTTATACRS